MIERWVESVPVLDHFARAADPSCYAPLPDDWRIGVSDVVDSTGAIEAGRYKAVNLAGAGIISAVTNALGGLPLFVFGGDGARFAVPPDQGPAAAEALARVAMWAERDLNLKLRVGMTTVAAVRAAGRDARVAFWQASEHVRYAMFTGGGLEWAEAQLKAGAIGLAKAAAGDEPDLTGLSCQWGPVLPGQGKILSLIVKPAPGASTERFAEITSEVIAVLESAAALNPVPAAGPDVRWPSGALALQARVADQGRPAWRRRLGVLVTAALVWLVFKTGLRVGGFDPDRYRREVAVNTDFRKFDDALMMTVDCSPETVARLRAILGEAVAAGVVRYGLHLQDEALMTCVVPSVLTPDHMHFVDGAGGGYAFAARQLRG
ncbi:MAG: DUF3095 domain-containing protein [Rhodospirillales bacterium]|nr:DUF3095 domain-containing protein [Rhodospirillales bacterium]MDH3969343.1 DUF3095 domain-containing protein [Rhodospirillales bacterium]